MSTARRCVPLRAPTYCGRWSCPRAKAHRREWRAPRTPWGVVEGVTLAFSLAVLAAFIVTVIIVIRNENDKRLRRKVRRSYVVSTVSIALVLFPHGFGRIHARHGPAHGARPALRHSPIGRARRQCRRERPHAHREGSLWPSTASWPQNMSTSREKINDEEFRRMFEAEIEADRHRTTRCATATRCRYRPLTAESLDAAADRMSAIEGVVCGLPRRHDRTPARHHHQDNDRTDGFGGALLIISLILLNNTIRLAIFSRRYLINTLKLVGATKGATSCAPSSVQPPEGAWAGVTAKPAVRRLDSGPERHDARDNHLNDATHADRHHRRGDDPLRRDHIAAFFTASP